MSTEKEALSVQIRIMGNATDIALGLEKNDLDGAEDKMFSISEDIGHLKVLVGVNNYSFKEMESIKNTLQAKIVDFKDKEGEYL